MKCLAVAAVLALTGCAAPGAEPPPELQGTLTVFAAASLTDVFDQLAHEFEADHPGLDVTVNYAGSTALAQQLVQGAPADVFAAASESAMDIVTDAGLTAHPVVFATNTIELAVPPSNPGRVDDLSDLERPELAVALCAPEVPCGEASQRVLDHAGVIPSVDTFEQDVRAVLTKVELGEVDAGLVYCTDVLASGNGVEGIEIPGAEEFETRYPIAATGTANRAAAAAFMNWVLSPAGKELLGDAGFGTP
ncbi:MAG: molybdenum transporter, periplasmic molybdate-binding protein [Rhodoglobus sp.]|nr:molybdenum transporter, periplasmic molybdate-binding protein [Rhodoglobus sp.]